MNFTCHEASLSFDIPALIAAIPELRAVAPSDIQEKVAAGGLLEIAEADGEAAGFKLGYALSSEVFYSWIGGVHPGFRRLGVAGALMKIQEDLVRERGFATIRVKSMNRFPSMLRLLIARSYNIVGTEGFAENCDALKIVFEKQLGRQLSGDAGTIRMDPQISQIPQIENGGMISRKPVKGA